MKLFPCDCGFTSVWNHKKCFFTITIQSRAFHSFSGNKTKNQVKCIKIIILRLPYLSSNSSSTNLRCLSLGIWSRICSDSTAPVLISAALRLSNRNLHTWCSQSDGDNIFWQLHKQNLLKL